MSRKSFLESNYYIHSTNSLSKLRGSLTKYDASSTERFNIKSNHRSMNQSLDFPSVLRNSNMKYKQAQNILNKPSILKKLFKSNSKTHHISKSKHKQTSFNTKNQTYTNNNKLELQLDFKDCIDRLDHSKHTHIGERQCFLGYKCFISIMSEMGYLSNWKVDSIMIDSIWKDLGGEDNQGFLKSNLLLLLEIIQGVNDYIQSRVRSFNTQQYQIRTEKNTIIYNKYKNIRQNRIQYKKDNKTNVLTTKCSNKQQIQYTNLTKLRKSFIHKNNQNSIKYPIKLRKRDKNQGDKRLCETLKTQNRIQNKSHTSKRAHLRLDVQPKLSECNSINQNQKQNRNSFESRLWMVQRNKTENLHNSKNPRFQQQCNVQQQEYLINNNLDLKRTALLSLDINLGEGKTQKIIIYQGDTPKKIAQDISKKHCLSSQISFKFQKILQNHLNQFLQKIQEVEQVTEDLISSIPNL